MRLKIIINTKIKVKHLIFKIYCPFGQISCCEGWPILSSSSIVCEGKVVRRHYEVSSTFTFTGQQDKVVVRHYEVSSTFTFTGQQDNSETNITSPIRNHTHSATSGWKINIFQPLVPGSQETWPTRLGLLVGRTDTVSEYLGRVRDVCVRVGALLDRLLDRLMFPSH